MSTLSNKVKQLALELVEDPVIQHNFELVMKQLQLLTQRVLQDSFVESGNTGSGTTITGSTPTSIDALRLPFSCNGGRVLVGLKPRFSDGNYTGAVQYGPGGANKTGSGYVVFLRDDKGIFTAPIINGFPALDAGNNNGIPPMAFCFWDKPGPGDHIYTVKAYTVGNGAITFNYCSLFAKEILG